MKPKLPLLVILMVAILLAAGMASGESLQPGQQALVKIALQNETDLTLVEAAGVPVYARMTGRDGLSYALAGISPAWSWPSALDITLLDPEMSEATYLLAYPPPGRPSPVWDDYGELLLDDGLRALLRMSSMGLGQLSVDGIEWQALTLDPKPLRPATASEVPTAFTGSDPLVQQMMNQVDSATVYSYTAGLSGEWPVMIGGNPYTIATRHTYSGEAIQKATQYVGEYLANLGLDVEAHQWGGSTYPNVIGELAGSDESGGIFIIGAHLDDMPSGSTAPGADDNASGSVAVLIAADIFTQYEWNCTLRFAFWTGEEQGLLGSHAYARRSYNQHEKIVGYLNLDMIGYNTPGSEPGIDLHANSDLPKTLVLAQLFADVVDAYNLDLLPEIVPDGTGASDHASFWEYGYSAILGIEDFGDFNPYYHTVDDQLQYLDIPYLTEFVKASLGTFVHMSGCLTSGILQGQVTSAADGSPIAHATVSISDAGGDDVSAATGSAGFYTRTLAAGSYTVTARSINYAPQTVNDVEIVASEVATQDLALRPLAFSVYLPICLRSN